MAKHLPDWNGDISLFERVQYQLGKDIADAVKQRRQADTSSEGLLKKMSVKMKFIPRCGGSRPRSVAVCGSYDNWVVRRPLAWDNGLDAFSAMVPMPSGKHMFKFIVDGVWQTSSDYEVAKDQNGILNNVIVVDKTTFFNC